jgi:hypothetical protein
MWNWKQGFGAVQWRRQNGEANNFGKFLSFNEKVSGCEIRTLSDWLNVFPARCNSEQVGRRLWHSHIWFRASVHEGEGAAPWSVKWPLFALQVTCRNWSVVPAARLCSVWWLPRRRMPVVARSSGGFDVEVINCRVTVSENNLKNIPMPFEARRPLIRCRAWLWAVFVKSWNRLLLGSLQSTLIICLWQRTSRCSFIWKNRGS